MNFGSPGFCGVYWHRPSQIHFGQLGHQANVSYSCCRFRNSRRCFCHDDRGLRRLLQLLRAAAAVHDLLSTAIRRAAIPRRRRDRDGVARCDRRASHAGAVSHRDGSADRDGGAARCPVRAHSAAIRHAPARRDGLAGLFLLRPGADGLRVLRLLSQRNNKQAQQTDFARCSQKGAAFFFCGQNQTRPGHGGESTRASRPATPGWHRPS